MSSSSDGVTPAPDLETTDIAEEIRRQLASARTNQTSGEVAQRHETVLSNIMLPGQVIVEPGETAEGNAVASLAIAPVANVTTTTGPEEEPQPVASAKLHTGPTTVVAPPQDAPLPDDSSVVTTAATFLPPVEEVAFVKTPASAAPTDAIDVKAPAEPVSTTSEVKQPEEPTENHDPIAATVISDQVTNEDASFNFAIPAGSFTDIDAGDHLTYTATLADGSALPSWLSFDPRHPDVLRHAGQ